LYDIVNNLIIHSFRIFTLTSQCLSNFESWRSVATEAFKIRPASAGIDLSYIMNLGTVDFLC